MTATPVVERVLDVDSHEMVPTELYEEVFGQREFQDMAMTFGIRDRPNPNKNSRPGHVDDDMPIDYDSVWKFKGPGAPSSIDLRRRPEVMDVMGIERQLVYPTFGLLSLMLLKKPDAHKFLGFDPSAYDAARLGREGIHAHNRWAVEITKSTSGRARPVGMVLAETVEGMIRQTEQLLADGIRALMLAANSPPGETSPAAPALDPFWRMAADANVPVTLHLGTDYGFLASTQWPDNVEVFNPSSKSTIEFVIEPYRASTVHFCAENFLTAIILGGVFERHPHLRFGIIELSASWLGPLAERLDMWVEEQFQSRFAGTLSMLPSEYITRNVRVTPFHFEPIAKYFDRYPNLQDVYCYSTDFPHFEGGMESKREFAEKLSQVTPDLRDKFFYRNASLLLPE